MYNVMIKHHLLFLKYVDDVTIDVISLRKIGCILTFNNKEQI